MAADTQHWDVGAYVLGVLDPIDVESFEIHLTGCDSCADEVAALLPVVAMLPAADAESLLTPRPAPRSFGPARAPVTAGDDAGSIDAGGNDTAESFRRKPRHGRSIPPARPYRRLAVAAGITAAALAGGSFIAGTQWSKPDAPVARASTGAGSEFSTSAPASGTHLEATKGATTARLTVATTQWGSQIELSLGGVRGPLRCELVAVGTDASSTVVASWSVSERGYGVPGQPNPLHIQAATAVSLAATSHFDIRATSPDGRVTTLISVPA